jgi:hypothetical protein
MKVGMSLVRISPCNSRTRNPLSTPDSRRSGDARFVREVDGIAVGGWYENLTVVRGLSAGTAVRHFNVMHHMMAKATTIRSKETGIYRNPADLIEVNRPDDARDVFFLKMSGAV